MKNSIHVIVLLVIGQTFGFQPPAGPQPERAVPSLKEQAIKTIAKSITSFEELNTIRSVIAPDTYALLVLEVLKNNPTIESQISTFAKTINSLAEFNQKTKLIAPEFYCTIIKHIIKNISATTQFTYRNLLELIDQHCRSEKIAWIAVAIYKLYAAEKLDQLAATNQLSSLRTRAEKTNDTLGQEVTTSIYELIDPSPGNQPAPTTLHGAAQSKNKALADQFFRSQQLTP